MRKNRIVYYLLFYSVLGVNLFANVVPEKRTTLIFAPFDFSWGDPILLGEQGIGRNYLQTACDDHEYEYDLKFIQTTFPGIMPKVKLDDFYREIQSGNYGVILIESHGDENGFFVEAYEDENICKSKYEEYNKKPEYKGLIDCGFTPGRKYWGIGVNNKFIEKYLTTPKNCIIWVSACNSFGLKDAFFSKKGKVSNYIGGRVEEEGNWGAAFTCGARFFWERFGGKRERTGDKKRNYTIEDASHVSKLGLEKA